MFKKILFGITEGKGFIMQKKELKKSIWLLRYSSYSYDICYLLTCFIYHSVYISHDFVVEEDKNSHKVAQAWSGSCHQKAVIGFL